MTGAILRRLREAHGISRKELAVYGVSIFMVSSLENNGLSRAKPEHWERKRASWRNYLDALRDAKKAQIATKSAVSPVKTSTPDTLPAEEITTQQKAIEEVWKPSPDAMQVEYLGVREWVKVSVIHGRQYGFVWRNGDWYRSSWVEAKLLQRAEKTYARSSSSVEELHYAGGRHG